MTEDMRERFVETVGNQIMLAVSCQWKPQILREKVDEKLRELWQAALSSAGTSQPNIQNLLDQVMKLDAREWRDEHGREIKGAHWVNRNDVVMLLGRAQSAGTSGMAEGSLFSDLVQLLRDCQEELRLIRMKDCGVVYDPTLRSRLHSFLSCVRGDSLSGKGEATMVVSESDGCSGSNEERRHETAPRLTPSEKGIGYEQQSETMGAANVAMPISSPAMRTCGTGPSDSETAVAPDRAEELAREISDMFNDRGRNYDNQPTIDELASLLRREMAAAPPREGG